jgi:hypothetical protein
VERICLLLLKYTRADIPSSTHDALPLLEYAGHIGQVGLDTDPGLAARRRRDRLYRRRES